MTDLYFKYSYNIHISLSAELCSTFVSQTVAPINFV